MHSLIWNTQKKSSVSFMRHWILLGLTSLTKNFLIYQIKHSLSTIIVQSLIKIKIGNVQIVKVIAVGLDRLPTQNNLVFLAPVADWKWFIALSFKLEKKSWQNINKQIENKLTVEDMTLKIYWIIQNYWLLQPFLRLSQPDFHKQKSRFRSNGDL